MRKLPFAAVTATLAVTMALASPSCFDSVDTAGVAGAAGGTSVDAGFTFGAGEDCAALANAQQVTARFEPSEIFLVPCREDPCPARDVRFVVDKDFCESVPVSFATSDETVAVAPPATDETREFCANEGETNDFCVALHKAAIPLRIASGAEPGTATITGRVPTSDPKNPTIATLKVHVLPQEVPDCSGKASTPSLKDGATLHGKGGLAGATIAVPKGATKPNAGGFLWHIDAFKADIQCSNQKPPPGFGALGPAITFGPAALSLPREIPVSIPLNPALIPSKARLRHLRVAYSGPAFKEPRTIPVADPRIEEIDGQWALSFKTPRLGTYQAVMRPDAGTHTFKRRLTHRAVIGVSMGGGGTATFGMRHHNLFDVLAPLGGPVDWTWLLHYIEQNHLGGFRPIPKGTVLADIQLTATPCTKAADCKADEVCLGVLEEPLTPGKCVFMPKTTEPYAHPQTFNNWWYEFPSSGNGGRFARTDYTQIFRDLAIMFGNPNGDNLSPGGENLPAGVPPTHPSVLGDHNKGECKFWVDPIDGDATQSQQEEVNASCPSERCAHTLSLSNYYDDEYNPDGTFPVITVCDGAPGNEALSPYANQWSNVTSYPLEVGLAVDYNGNGVRDELEPIVRAGHETWYDHGTDGVPSELEPGYKKGVNEDPNGDDYDAQFNPTGTENDHRYQPGEKFDDFGLDGVPGTKQQPKDGWKKPGDGYDVGEGDGKLTIARGLQTFWDRDPRSVLRHMVDASKVPGGELSDDALRRIDVWTDGGTRDLFNFAVDAQNFAGALVARNRDTAYFTNFVSSPGLDAKDPNSYQPSHVVYDDLQGVVFQRYGNPDPTEQDIEYGSGKHVGTGTEILMRLQSALYFIGSRWKDPELHILSSRSADDPVAGATECEILGNCELEFTSKSGRKAPVGVTLPPGYAHKALQGLRYPVIYVLHGYGQNPTDLLAAQALFTNWMNNPVDGNASRLPKAIIVYVDGRCRVTNGKSECLRGTFYTDSVMKQGAQDETWWLELIDFVDKKYRTLGESLVDWTE